ncbi:hypothetical protein OsI_01245 [Oryza sativa Indica Group]|uniref:Plastocyanin-like domain-containing protein n=1 Tax=Oryza sativa subsp. indica TaxID=39946 RepID=B8AC89_ORYSI|nr:hypothetical protein OsI_01245 [Oryza sativa Indica Group]
MATASSSPSQRCAVSRRPRQRLGHQLPVHVLDYVRKLAVTINGHTLGPTIHAVQGDTIVVNVKNSLLTENVAIHWHDIRQIGTPWADGTEGVTQCPILPGDTFTYTFIVDRPGTYMYHAHYGCSARRSTYEQAAGLVFVPMVWVGEPQSLLINGRSRFMNCSSSPATVAASCNMAHPDCAPAVFAVVPGKMCRFRIASVTSLFVVGSRPSGSSSSTPATPSRSAPSTPPQLSCRPGCAVAAVLAPTSHGGQRGARSTAPT